MRKITKEIHTAWKNGSTMSKGNTITDGQKVWLHGNCIVNNNGGFDIVRSRQGTFVSDGGYGYSRTTAERLKPWTRFTRKKGKLFMDERPYKSGEWFRVDV